ncbi:MAG TPA: nitroreductase family deazaflavin-dependent oxidoreductase [Acidimicrobiaceae bacterium]|nr:nitroreductase family deazaflavin-dependent oxidoreductase [Acidimicrobiaceae bacterium]
MRTPDRVIDVGTWMLENGHRALLKLSGGRFPKRLLGMHAVQLVTIGRKTGERRPTLLSAPVYEENRVVLVASKGGYQDHPQWYKNLAANPAVEITVDGRTRAMRARTATPEEREALWPTIVATYKGYAGYQANTARQIPVVICEPLSG